MLRNVFNRHSPGFFTLLVGSGGLNVGLLFSGAVNPILPVIGLVLGATALAIGTKERQKTATTSACRAQQNTI